MKVLVVLTFELPNADEVVTALEAIDPPNLPWFAGQARIVIEPHASQVEKWLDEE